MLELWVESILNPSRRPIWGVSSSIWPLKDSTWNWFNRFDFQPLFRKEAHFSRLDSRGWQKLGLNTEIRAFFSSKCTLKDTLRAKISGISSWNGCGFSKHMVTNKILESIRKNFCRSRTRLQRLKLTISLWYCMCF